MTADPATSAEIKDWEFDKIFNGSSGDGNTQEAVFNDTSLLITSAIDGFNVVSCVKLCKCSSKINVLFQSLLVTSSASSRMVKLVLAKLTLCLEAMMKIEGFLLESRLSFLVSSMKKKVATHLRCQSQCWNYTQINSMIC